MDRGDRGRIDRSAFMTGYSKRVITFDEVAIAKVARKVQRSPVTRVFEPVDNLGQILLRARVAGGKKRGRKRRMACAA